MLEGSKVLEQAAGSGAWVSPGVSKAARGTVPVPSWRFLHGDNAHFASPR
jgi:hypothetical protein